MTEPGGHYSVLVVDDDPDWVEDVTYQSSTVNFEVSKDIGSALKSIENNPGYDLVIVDLFLKNSIGLDLIEKVREKGLATPFVIASNESPDALRNSNGELFERYLDSGAIEYLDKAKLPGAKGFELLVRFIIDTFSRLVSRFDDVTSSKFAEIANAAGSIIEANEVLMTYRRSIDYSASFERLSSQIKSDAGYVKSIASSHSMDSVDVRAAKIARYYDYIPDVKNRRTGLVELHALSRKKGNVGFSRDVLSSIKRISSLLKTRDRNEAISRVFTSYAEELQLTGDLSNAVNVLVSLSDELKATGAGKASIGIRLLSAHLLVDNGRLAAGKVFVDDAYADAIANRETEYIEYISKRFPQFVGTVGKSYE